MKQLTLQFLLFLLCVSSCWEMSAQSTTLSVPQINFQRSLGGSGQDSSIFATVTSTGDYLFIGNTTSTNGDVVGNHGGKDIWMVKVNASGTILSQACLGGSSDDYAINVNELANDEYLINGITNSGNGSVVGYSGSGSDAWMLKINASGTILWQQCSSGVPQQTMLLSNGNMLTVQWITSAGSANNYHGGIDSWVKIIDPTNGTFVLNRCYGGTTDDKIVEVLEENGAVIMTGVTNSTNGDITGQHGGYDIWTMKIDAAGNIINQKVLGSAWNEYYKRVYKDTFGHYVIEAYSAAQAQSGDVANYQAIDSNLIPSVLPVVNGEASQFWSLMLDNSLTLLWEHTINTLVTESTAWVGTGIGVNGTYTAASRYGTSNYNNYSMNKESLPALDGGVFIIGQTMTHDSTYWYTMGTGYMYHYLVKISPLGLITSNQLLRAFPLEDNDEITFSYTLTANGTVKTHEYCLDVCPFCADSYNKYNREINDMGQYLSECDTFGTITFGIVSTSYNGVCPITTASIVPPYGNGNQGAASYYALQNDTCTSGNYTHLSNTDFVSTNYYGASIKGQSTGNNWSMSFFSAYIHRLHCYPAGVFVLANNPANSSYVVGNHGQKDFWLVNIEDPNNLYGGKLWKDNNTNTIYDTGDQLMANRIFKVNLNSSTTPYYIPTDSMGRYRIATGTDTLTALLTNPPLYHSYAPNQFAHIFTTNGNTDTLNDVVLTPIPNMSDMDVSLTAINNPQPGFDTDYNLAYKNKGTVAKTGAVRMTWNSADQIFVSATPTPDTLTTSYAAWKYTNMPSLASASINIKLNTTSFNLGANIQNIANIYPILGDQTPVDNQDSSNIILTGAYDPNDIAVSDTLIDSTYISNDGYVYYTIRFQNTGTAPAQNILVEAVTGWWNGQIDITSFEPVAQSHPYSLVAPKSAGQTNLQFKFSNIQLPFTGAASHGFVKFRVKLKNFSRCQLVMANAKIYFDYNPPIVTNTVQTRHALPKPVITANGPTTFCTGGGANVVLAAPAGMQTYTWSLNNSHSPTLTVTYPIGATTLHYLTVKKQAGCYATSLPFNVTVNALPIATITNTGLLTFCDAQANTTLNANVVAGSSYTWNLNGTAIGGATNPTYAPTQSGVYTYTVVDSNGCTKTSATKTITVNPSPTVTITASGSTTNCVGDTLLLTSTATSGVTYQWQKNNGNLSGATNPNLNATTTGNYRVIVATTANCKDTSTIIASTFSTIPTANISNVGALTFCEGGSVTLNVSTGTNYTYTWNESGLAISGANNSAYTATQSGTYTATVNNNGCEKTSLAKVVTVNTLPAIPLISQSANTLSSTSSSGNQWYLNGNPISNATGANYNATQSGTYTVNVTDGNGCSSISDPYTFIYVGLDNNPLTQSLQVYPNPASQNLNINFEKTSKKATSILLTNALGQVVYEKNIAEIGNIEMTIDVTSFSEGVYRLELKGEEGQASKNIVVLKP